MEKKYKVTFLISGSETGIMIFKTTIPNQSNDELRMDMIREITKETSFSEGQIKLLSVEPLN